MTPEVLVALIVILLLALSPLITLFFKRKKK